MTATVGKKEVRLGWEAFAGIIVFTVATTWGAGKYFEHQESKTDQIIAMLKIESASRRSKDSIQDIQLDVLKIRSDSTLVWHSRGTVERRATNEKVKYNSDRIDYIIRLMRMPTSFRTERMVNGKMIIEDVKP